MAQEKQTQANAEIDQTNESQNDGNGKSTNSEKQNKSNIYRQSIQISAILLITFSTIAIILILLGFYVQWPLKIQLHHSSPTQSVMFHLILDPHENIVISKQNNQSNIDRTNINNEDNDDLQLDDIIDEATVIQTTKQPNIIAAPSATEIIILLKCYVIKESHKSQIYFDGYHEKLTITPINPHLQFVIPFHSKHSWKCQSFKVGPYSCRGSIANFTLAHNLEAAPTEFDVFCDQQKQERYIQGKLATTNNINNNIDNEIFNIENTYDKNNDNDILNNIGVDSSDEIQDKDDIINPYKLDSSPSANILTNNRALTIAIATLVIILTMLIKSMLMLFNQK